MRIALFQHGNLVENELMGALKRHPNIQVIAIDVVNFSTTEQAPILIDVLQQHNVNILVTVNNWGFDSENIIGEWLSKRGIPHINWCVDDPFFYEFMEGIVCRPFPNRIDFISDRGRVDELCARGYAAHFLPLAVDHHLFYKLPEQQRLPQRDLFFVGNSYHQEMQNYLGEDSAFYEAQIKLISACVNKYRNNMQYPIENDISTHLTAIKLPTGLSYERAFFVIRYFIGYLFRKRTVLDLIEQYPEFKVYGDVFWNLEVPLERIGLDVKYYTNLNEAVQQSKINIDINRTIIRDGFTQRIFDCLATESFVITSPKQVVHDFFVTEGPDAEVAVFKNPSHLHELIDYYLIHEDERKAMAERGYRKVLAQHTYDHRVTEIFRVLSQEMERWV